MTQDSKKHLYNSGYGFTLVELSIVLVIIGLIIGGVLVGKDLIEGAKIKAQITQLEEIETQINTFRLKYNCLPGDCSTATDFFGTSFGSSTIVNGDNNGSILSQSQGYIAGDCLSARLGGEVTQLFLHLRLAGLSKFAATGLGGAVGSTTEVNVGIDIPTATIDGYGGVFITCMRGSHAPATLENGNSIALGAGHDVPSTRAQYRLGYSGNPTFGIDHGISPVSAGDIDRKTDDGIGTTGRIITLWDCNGNSTISNYQSVAPDCKITFAKNIK